MCLHVPFIFRNKPAHCTVYIGKTASPYSLFVDLKDEKLIEEFGLEITIKTDFNVRLSRRHDYPELIALSDAIFSACLDIPEVMARRRLLMNRASYLKKYNDK